MNFWLHRCHGSLENELIAQPAHRAPGSIAENFAASLCDVSEGMLGVACCLQEGSIVAVSADQTKSVIVTPVLFAEVTLAALPEGAWTDMAVVAVVPPQDSKGLKGTIIDGAENAGSLGWYVVIQGLMQAYDMLDALSGIGGLRCDLATSFSIADADDCVIGEGAYAKVLRMVSRDGHEVAVKQMNFTADYDSIEREIGALIQLQGPNVVGFRGIFWFVENEQVLFSAVLNLAPHGDLLYKVLKSGVMEENSSKPMFTGILNGLLRMHERGIVHRDIKTENILLDAGDVPMVADFGLACYITDEAQMTRRCGSAGFVAPEVCLGTPYDCKVDNFSAGVILYFILSKEMPFSSANRDSAATMRKTVKCSLHLHRPPWDTMTSRLRNMLRQMICKNQEERLTAVEALEHSWLVGKSKKDKVAPPAASGEGPPDPPRPSMSLHSEFSAMPPLEESPVAPGAAESYIGDESEYSVRPPLPE